MNEKCILLVNIFVNSLATSKQISTRTDGYTRHQIQLNEHLNNFVHGVTIFFQMVTYDFARGSNSEPNRTELGIESFNFKRLSRFKAELNTSGIWSELVGAELTIND